jgi:hypothetical protein
MRDEEAGWSLAGFLDRLDAWSEQEKAPGDLTLLVTAWIMSRYDDPYGGVRLEPGFDNLWFGPVPGSEDGRGRVVVCSYWISERSRTVTCNGFATLDLPI